MALEQPTPLAGDPKPVLLLNLSPDSCEMYTIGLAIAGFQAHVASDAASALRALDHEHPIAVVADLVPGAAGEGWQLIEAIRRYTAAGKVPIVVLTGRVDAVTQSLARRAGCAVLVQTPCLPAELARVLESVSPGAGPRPGGLRILQGERRRHRRGDVGGEPHRRSLQAMILGSYREMPGLSLSLQQAARLFGLRERTCRIVLDALVNDGVLRRSTDGQYVAPGMAR
jgi:DNA-binding response OmpR family regulator